MRYYRHGQRIVAADNLDGYAVVGKPLYYFGSVGAHGVLQGDYAHGDKSADAVVGDLLFCFANGKHTKSAAKQFIALLVKVFVGALKHKFRRTDSNRAHSGKRSRAVLTCGAERHVSRIVKRFDAVRVRLKCLCRHVVVARCGNNACDKAFEVVLVAIQSNNLFDGHTAVGNGAGFVKAQRVHARKHFDTWQLAHKYLFACQFQRADRKCDTCQ